MENGKDISNETSRSYFHYDGHTTDIIEPKTLWVSENGHRIETKYGVGYYIFLKDVRVIEWVVRDKARVVEV